MQEIGTSKNQIFPKIRHTGVLYSAISWPVYFSIKTIQASSNIFVGDRFLLSFLTLFIPFELREIRLHYCPKGHLTLAHTMGQLNFKLLRNWLSSSQSQVVLLLKLPLLYLSKGKNLSRVVEINICGEVVLVRTYSPTYSCFRSPPPHSPTH